MYMYMYTSLCICNYSLYKVNTLVQHFLHVHIHVDVDVLVHAAVGCKHNMNNHVHSAPQEKRREQRREKEELHTIKQTKMYMCTCCHRGCCVALPLMC